MRQQEMERQRLEQEEMSRQSEMKRQEEERQRQQQMLMQQQQEKMILQQQREQMQQQEQMQMQHQQQQVQQQQMQMEQHHQTTSMTTQEQKISSITKAGGFSYGAIPTKEPKSQPQQTAMPPMSSSSLSFESSQSQSQQFSSVQQSSSSFSSQQQSQSEIYESQEFNGGIMKGYRRKDEALTSANSNNRDSGIFTGINGDANSLVDEEFDYKKHTVKDLAAHFALVKPKQNIPHNILPEQKIYNGDHGPALNYLGATEADGQVHSLVRKEMSQQDVEASKAAYEMKKKQQMEQQQQSSTTSTTTSSSSTVVKRTETSSRSEQEAKSERRMSLRDSLMLDPAQAHADAD